MRRMVVTVLVHSAVPRLVIGVITSYGTVLHHLSGGAASTIGTGLDTCFLGTLKSRHLLLGGEVRHVAT